MLSESYRDWVLTCRIVGAEDTPPARRCEIAQELQADTGQRVLRMVLEVSDPKDAALTLVTPFGVLVLDGVGIAAAGIDPARIDFLNCLSGGCVAKGVLAATMVDAVLAADSGTISMNAANSDKV
jgi:invasion protein IalB